MKDFMLIFIGPDYPDLGLSPEQTQARMGKWFAWHEKMSKQGIVRDGHALQNFVTRITGSERTRSDVAGSEVKELVGGYYVVQARDLDHAVEIAQDFPDYDLGSTVEVREVMVFEEA